MQCTKTKTGAILTAQHNKSTLAGLTLAAIGIVYGDIGTSPLYTLKTVFSPEHGLTLTPDNLLGIISLIFWGLTVIVSLKYVTLVLRADNRGEGGIMALMALALSSVNRLSNRHKQLMLCGVFGAALFYGDSVITPAISVLSAIEGLEVATPAMKPLCGAADHYRAGGAVLLPGARHGGHRPLVRSRHGVVVLLRWPSWASSTSSPRRKCWPR